MQYLCYQKNTLGNKEKSIVREIATPLPPQASSGWNSDWMSWHIVHVFIGWQISCLFYSLSYGREFYNGDCTLPVYKWSRSREHYPLETLAKLLITDTVPSSSICSKQPVQVCRNASFVVDLHQLDDPADVRADENGVWKRKGSPVAYVSMHTNEGKTRFFRRAKAPTRSNQYKITQPTIVMPLPLTLPELLQLFMVSVYMY